MHFLQCWLSDSLRQWLKILNVSLWFKYLISKSIISNFMTEFVLLTWCIPQSFIEGLFHINIFNLCKIIRYYNANFLLATETGKNESVSNYLLFNYHNITAGYHWFYEILHVDELEFGTGGILILCTLCSIYIWYLISFDILYRSHRSSVCALWSCFHLSKCIVCFLMGPRFSLDYKAQ